jgi:uncharacterized alkaline shock family protein YloU
MAILIRNDNGIIAIEDDILRDIVIDTFNGNSKLVLSNKKGKPQKNNKASIKIREENSRLCIAMCMIVLGGNSVDYVNSQVEKQFELIIERLQEIAVRRDVVCEFNIANLEKRLRRYHAYEEQ